MNKITYIDGERWYRALIAGIRYVISRQEHLNNINVFPVPDRDTGTNLALTLNAVIQGTYTAPKNDFKHLFDTVADSALSGARGNSGTIMAQFFQGMAESIELTTEKLEANEFSAAVKNGLAFSYTAISEPKEGTILSVIKAYSDQTEAIIQEGDADFVKLLHDGLDSAKIALQNTTTQLKELKKAHVVDAGAQGFVDLLQGISDFVEKGSLRHLLVEPNSTIIEPITEEISAAINEKYRYCTECLITGKDIKQTQLRETLKNYGDCMIVAGSTRKTKVHIHTNDPNQVFEICQQQGIVIDEKADDMIQQQTSINHKRNQVAILTDSSADVPEGMIAKLDIHVVPLQLHFGEHSFIDKVTISPQEFYTNLRNGLHHPTTSQPSFGDFQRQYQYLYSHYHSIVAIHISRVLSGTISVSETAATKTAEQDITVIDSLYASCGQGLIVLKAAEAAKQGATKEEVIAITQQAIKKTRFFILLPDISYLARGGRLSARKKRFLEMFHLNPILGFDSKGNIKLAKCLLGHNKLDKKMVKFICKQIDPHKQYRMIVSYGDCKQQAQSIKADLEKQLTNIESISIARTGSTLGAHAGPETFAIALQECF